MTPIITPQAFITKWSSSKLKERSGSQEHFIDLCRLLGEPTPADVDPDGTWYTFERGAKKTGGGDGWADVWKRGHFAWEYKGKHKDLDAALKQLQLYAIALENPPILVVSDMETIRIHTNFTNTVQDVRAFSLDDLEKPEVRQVLKWVFTDPERLRPGVTREQITEQAAKEFAGLAHRLHERGYDPQRVAHFTNKILFCMFAEDIEILPKGLFSKMLEAGAKDPSRFVPMAQGLFQAMQKGGFFGADAIDWFNGGLFDDDDVLPLDADELKMAIRASRLDWSDIEPSIFGTLFERGLDPVKRSQLGAHYTDRQSIMRIVEPVVLQPLWAEWEGVKEDIKAKLAKADSAKTKASVTKAMGEAKGLYETFLRRLADYRVLDPACGSGNFLYLALLGLKDLENRVILDAEVLGLPRAFPRVGPQCVMGIELNAYAAELARVTIWIGQIQWMVRQGWSVQKNPILQKLDQVANRDALLNEDGTEAEWPRADAIVGNPPFLGGAKLIPELGEDYVSLLRTIFKGRVPGGADLVTYWFEKARAQVDQTTGVKAGLVATNSIRGGSNRKVLERIKDTCLIFDAWSDEPWVLEGAAVRVSLICFGTRIEGQPLMLNGRLVSDIFADLTGPQIDVTDGTASLAVDLTVAAQLADNLGVAFQGAKQNGAFDIEGDLARKWLQMPTNPNGRHNSDVLRPSCNGFDLTRRSRDLWAIDFSVELSEAEAALYEAPFEYVLRNVKPERENAPSAELRRFWWRHGRPRVAMRAALAGLPRFIATCIHAKYRLFIWLDASVLPDHALVAIAREDDATFGILHSRFHEAWALRLGTSLEDRPRYTPSTTFETFPFPQGLTPDIPAANYVGDPRAVAIAEAARRLNELRENWLNPPDLVKRVPEVVPNYPDRVLPVDEKAAQELKKRTLTNLYNQKPTWLIKAHEALDTAVAAAYGWDPAISDEEALQRLFELNQARSSIKPAETVAPKAKRGRKPQTLVERS